MLKLTQKTGKSRTKILKPGWMLKADPELANLLKQAKERIKAEAAKAEAQSVKEERQYVNLTELLDRAKKKALEKPDTKDGYAPKSTDELRFKKKHVVQSIDDRNGNKDDVFKATNVKTLERAKDRHGYDVNDDEQVYEETEQSSKQNRLDAIRKASKKIDPNKFGSEDKTTIARSGAVSRNTTQQTRERNNRIKKILKNSYELEDEQNNIVTEQDVTEVLNPSMGAAAYIHDFVKSKNPKFAGKSKKERMKQALASYYAAKRGQ